MKFRIMFSILFVFVIRLGAAQVSEYSEELITLPEIWMIEGQKINVRGTLITGKALFTVHVFVDYPPTQRTDDRSFARKIAIYAIENGYLYNACMYNRFSDDYDVRKDVVGVALLHVIDEEKGEISASRFAFLDNELLGEDAEIPAFPLPRTFTDIDKQTIRKRIREICESEYYDELYSLYSENALKDFDIDEARKRTRVQLSLAKKITFPEEGFTVYVGTKGGIRAYNHFIPITVIPVADEKKKINIFFQVFIVDEPEKYAIYGVDLQFPDIESLRIFTGSGSTVEFGVQKDRE